MIVDAEIAHNTVQAADGLSIVAQSLTHAELHTYIMPLLERLSQGRSEQGCMLKLIAVHRALVHIQVCVVRAIQHCVPPCKRGR